MTQSEAEIRALAARRHLPESQLARWLAADARSRAAILEFARTLSLRTGQLAESLDLLEEIAVRDRAPISEILARPALARLLTAAGSRPDRARDFVVRLRAIRFPRLAEFSARLEAEVAALRLPADVRLLLPARLASDELTVQFKVSSAGALDRALEAIAKRRDEIARIVDLLGGKDEV